MTDDDDDDDDDRPTVAECLCWAAVLPFLVGLLLACVK